ncbi:MAG: GNAT family N-acetyltransferase [Promethearchaeota archaeon]
MKKPKLFINTFDPQTASDDVWEKFFEAYKKYQEEMYPGDPLPSNDRLKKEMKNPGPDPKDFRWLVFSEETNMNVIGYGRVTIYNESSPAYQSNKHVASGMLFIDKEYRRLGIGTELLMILVTKVKREQKTVFQGGSQHESGKEFCQKFGAKIALTEEENRLNLEDVDWDMINEWKIEGPKRAEGVTIEMFETVPEKDIEEYCKIYAETLNQVPKGELEWEAVETPKTRRIREKRRKLLGATWTTMITREENGVISGLTETIYNPDRETLLFQALTGVKKEYRGRGLGKWLKAEMVTYIKKTFPEVKYLVTDFSITNAPMIAINKRLGFKKHMMWTEYKFNVEDLCQRLGL